LFFEYFIVTTNAIQTLTITQPDDWHIHLRDGAALARTVPDIARVFNRVICMPNLVPPVTTVDAANAYRARIMAHVSQGVAFDPRMTIYLTDHTDPAEIAKIKQSEFVQAVKLYPAGATTNSHSGVSDLSKVYDVIAQMEEHGVPFLLHGEVTHSDVDIFDREKRFLDDVLDPLLKRFSRLRMVLEHITTADAAAFVQAQGANVAATITPQHLLFNRNHMLVGGIRPHFYCLPILKRQTHQAALIQAATSGNPQFFLGTDSAPHAQDKKENACGCAGCYTAPIAIELYAQAFEQANALDKLEGFASFFGADFYGLPRNTQKITLVKQSQQVPDSYPYFKTQQLVPLRAGETLNWSVQSERGQ
jgi:dihydroorotase